MPAALIVIDMINTYDFPDADKVAASAESAVPVIASLVERAREADVPVIYVNDNFGGWDQGRGELVEEALSGKHAELVEPLAPAEGTDFVVKARHSAFYETPLEYHLRQLEVDEVVLVGQVTEQCILYSALDAHIRHFAVRVPPDAVAHIHSDLAAAALKMMEVNMGADLTPAAEIPLAGADSA